MDLLFGSLSPETRWVVALGALIVIWFASYQYKHWTGNETERPDNPPRHYTTFIRFYFFGLVYIVIFLLAFAILIAMPQQIVIALKDQAKGIDSAMKLLGAVADPRFIFAVLFLTTASTNIPVVVKWEKSIRKTLHDFAKTPQHVRDLVNYLMHDYKNKFNPSDRDVKEYFSNDTETGRYLYSQCFPDGGSQRNTKDRLTDLWLEISYVRWMVRQVAPDTTGPSCMTTCRNQFDLFERNYDRLKPDVELYYLAKATHDASDNLLERLEREVRRKAEALLRELLTVVCCGIYATQRSKAERTRALETFSLDTHVVGLDPVNWQPIFTGTVLVFVAALICTTFYHYFAPSQTDLAKSEIIPVPENWPMILLWSFVGMMTHGFAVVIAIFFSRQVLPGTRLSSEGIAAELMRNKIKAGFWSAFTSGFLCLCILLSLFAHPAVRKLIPEIANKYNLWIAFNEAWPWCFIPMVTAVFTAIHREDAMARNISPGLKPIIKRSAVQAGITFAVGTLAALVVLENITITKSAFLIFAATTSLLFGAVLGWVMPSGYRETIAKKDRIFDTAHGIAHPAPAMGA
jgi:hypothetical protein